MHDFVYISIHLSQLCLDPNPHMGNLAWADAFVITADSVSMLSEACSTGYVCYILMIVSLILVNMISLFSLLFLLTKDICFTVLLLCRKPVYVIGSERCTWKFADFQKSLFERGAVRPFTGKENVCHLVLNCCNIQVIP